MSSWSRQTGWVRNRSFARNDEGRCLLTDAERAEYERLAAWYLAWTPPAGAYQLGPHVRVIDAHRSHRERCQRIRGGLTGQQQRAALIWMRTHWTMFGGDSCA